AVGTALSVGTGVTVAEGTDSVGTASVGTARRYPTDSPIDLVGHTPPERPPATSSAAPIDLVGNPPPERPPATSSAGRRRRARRGQSRRRLRTTVDWLAVASSVPAWFHRCTDPWPNPEWSPSMRTSISTHSL